MRRRPDVQGQAVFLNRGGTTVHEIDRRCLRARGARTRGRPRGRPVVGELRSTPAKPSHGRLCVGNTFEDVDRPARYTDDRTRIKCGARGVGVLQRGQSCDQQQR